VRGTGTLFNGGPNGEAFTIQGETNNSGSLGTNELAIVNRSGGLIHANVSTLQLFVDPRANGGLLNLGVMQASSGGILTLTGNGGGAFENSAGVIRALAGSEVRLQSGATINGGTLTTVGSGVIRNFNTASLSGVTIAGSFIANNGADTTISGTITNTGSISTNSMGSFTDLLLAGNTTLLGNGVLSLSNAARVRGSGILTNVGNTIQGETSNSGSLGGNEIGIVNQAAGIIDANVANLVLNVDPNAANGLLNEGLMRASNGGILLLNGNGGGAFTNSGTIQSVSGGVLRFNGTVTSTGTVNVGSGTLTATGNYTQSDGTFLLAGGSVQSNNALNFQGGLIDARGTMNASILNNAILRPALGGNGLNVTGNVSLLTSSRLTFQLGGLVQGSQYGFMNVNGIVTLGGQLVLSFVNGFQNVVSPNDTFTLMTSSSAFIGNFTNITFRRTAQHKRRRGLVPRHLQRQPAGHLELQRRQPRQRFLDRRQRQLE
jgi:hypothetical protein